MAAISITFQFGVFLFFVLFFFLLSPPLTAPFHHTPGYCAAKLGWQRLVLMGEAR